MSWYETAWKVIDKAHREMPLDISFEERKKRIRDAYPFGERAYHPYKQWCKAQREYLARYVPKPRYFAIDEGLFAARGAAEDASSEGVNS